jgi:hypothetical protein
MVRSGGPPSGASGRSVGIQPSRAAPFVMPGALVWALAIVSPAYAADDRIDSFTISHEMQPTWQRSLCRDRGR